MELSFITMQELTPILRSISIAYRHLYEWHIKYFGIKLYIYIFYIKPLVERVKWFNKSFSV
jgi:hypothetical protein